jgi:hypothetical protein
MNAALPTSGQMIFVGLFSVTSSPALVAGRSRSGSLDGQKTAGPGPALAPVSPSQQPESAEAPGTPGIYGRSGLDSLPNVADSSEFQRSLASKLQARMAAFGSLEYDLVWRTWDINLGPPICALRASARRTSGRGCSGWRSPDHNQRGGSYSDQVKALARLESGHQINLEDQAVLAGWNTPRATDGSNGGPNQTGGALPADAALAGMTESNMTGNTDALNASASITNGNLSGWCSPTAQDGSRGNLPPRPQDTGVPLSQQAALAGWPTASARDWKSGTSRQHGENCRPLNEVAQSSGTTTTLSHAQTEKRGALNPALSRWLQGYSVEWCQAAIRAFRKLKRQPKAAPCGSEGTETPSTHTSRRNSSKPTSMPKTNDNRHLTCLKADLFSISDTGAPMPVKQGASSI